MLTMNFAIGLFVTLTTAAANPTTVRPPTTPQALLVTTTLPCDVGSDGCLCFAGYTATHRPWCSCTIGYQANGSKCIDIDECQRNNGECSHSCTNLNGTFVCSCPLNETLHPDGRICTARVTSTTTARQPVSAAPCTGEECAVKGTDPNSYIIIGVVLAVLVLLAVGLVVFFCLRRRSKDSERSGDAVHLWPLGDYVSPGIPADPVYNGDVQTSSSVRRPMSQGDASDYINGSVGGASDYVHRPIGGPSDYVHRPIGGPSDYVNRPVGGARGSITGRWKEKFIASTKEKMEQGKFKEEFKMVDAVAPHEYKDAQRKGLKKKLRFNNIAPYDKNRVVLDEIPDEPLSDFVNASHIEGFSIAEGSKYIASIGPINSMVDDFWRMVWEQDVTLIVMVTRLVENGQVKCIQYWPESGKDETFKYFNVKCMQEIKRLEFTIRELEMSNDTMKRPVKQIQFTGWPDYGVPDGPAALLKFHRQVKKHVVAGTTVLVHCGAGVGRTGTFLAIDHLLQRAEAGQEVDVIETVRKLRDQRMSMVQTQSQYEFIHETLVEAFTISETAIPCSVFLQRWENITKRISDEYKALEDYKPNYTENDLATAMLPKNRDKNRNPEVIPRSEMRPHLAYREGETDYINAVFVNNYQRAGAFITTHTPLPETMDDFWNLVYTFQCEIVILFGCELSDLIPDEGESPMKNCDVVVTEPETQHTSLAITKLLVAYDTGKTAPGGASSVQLSQVPVVSGTWLPYTTLTHIYNHHCDNPRSRILFVSRDGVQHCDVTIAAMSMMYTMSQDGEVDVLSTVRDIRKSRPEFIGTEGEYQYLYNIAYEYINAMTNGRHSGP